MHGLPSLLQPGSERRAVIASPIPHPLGAPKLKALAGVRAATLDSSIQFAAHLALRPTNAWPAITGYLINIVLVPKRAKHN
jgi:hypothetical protein